MVKGIDTKIPIKISIVKAKGAVASHSIGSTIMCKSINVAFKRPERPLSAQRQTTAVIVSEMAQGSMIITRASPRPKKSSLRMIAIGSEMTSVPPTTATVQISVRQSDE